MNLTRYNQRYYSTPQYAATDPTHAVFGARRMPVASHSAQARGHYAGIRRRFAGFAMLRTHNPDNAS
jgi:hypothetical protein